MRWTILTLAALALAAGCDRAPEGSKAAAPQPSQVNTPAANAQTPSASSGATASKEEKKEGANPVQGQVDPKAPEQLRDFKQKGDGAGPKPGG